VKSTTKQTSSKSLLEKLKREVRASSSKAADSNKYDNYIDANNDGVDDRLRDKTRTKTSADSSSKSDAPAPDESSHSSPRKKKDPRQ
jgi:hypothetical protein